LFRFALASNLFSSSNIILSAPGRLELHSDWLRTYTSLTRVENEATAAAAELISWRRVESVHISACMSKKDCSF
jgi:hypothetical protein